MLWALFISSASLLFFVLLNRKKPEPIEPISLKSFSRLTWWDRAYKKGKI